MKKITKIIAIGIFLLGIPKIVNAEEYINRGDIIPNIKVHIKRDDKEYNLDMYKSYINSKDKFVYSLNYENPIKEGYNIHELDEWHNMDSNLKKEIMNIIYFGYQYKDRTSIDWYILTQYLVWETMLEDKGEIYFINNNSEKVVLYESKIEQIKKDIEDSKTFPSFASNDININTNINNLPEFVDENDILKDCEIDLMGAEAKIENNSLKVTKLIPGLNRITIRKKDQNLASDFARVYITPNKEIVASRGYKENETRNIDIRASFNLTIHSANKNYDLSGLKYKLEKIDDFMSPITISLNSNESNIELSSPGEYKLTEIEVPDNYELTNEEIVFNITSDNVSIDIHPKLKESKKNQVQLVSNTSSTEEDIFYYLYDSNKNIISKLKLDKDGNLKLSNIKKGDYYLGKELSEETIKITLNDNTAKINVNDLLNNVGSLKIQKKDEFNNQGYTGYHLGLYDKNHNLISELITDNIDSSAYSKNLAPGIYYIKELSEYGRVLDKDLKVEIKPGIETFILIKDKESIKVPITGKNKIPFIELISLAFIGIGTAKYVFKK